MDEVIQCKDCPNTFVFTAKDQAFFASKRTEDGQPWTPPKRCKPCRAAAKQKKEASPSRSAPKTDGVGHYHPGGGYSTGAPVAYYARGKGRSSQGNRRREERFGG